MRLFFKSYKHAILKRIGGEKIFRQNLLRVASASGLAKIFGILSLPVLSRFYAPEDYATFAAFTAFCAISTSVSTLRFEWLVPNAKNEIEAAELIIAGFCSMIVSTLTFAGIIFLFKSWFENLFFRDISISELWPLIFLLSILGGSIQYLIHGWLIYVGNLTYYALGLVIQSAFTPILSLLFAVLVPDTIMSGGSKLIIAYLSSLLIACVTICVGHSSDVRTLFSVDLKNVSSVFSRNRKLAGESVLVSLVNALSANLLLFLIGYLFGNRVMGVYAMAQRLVFAPVSLITSSIANSFWAETARLAKKNPLELKSFYVVSLKRLTFLAVLLATPLVGLSFFIEPILGADWNGAGLMCLILIPLVMATLVFSSTNHLVVYEKQIYQLVSDATGLMAAILTMVVFHSLQLSPVFAIFMSMNLIALAYGVRGWSHFYALSGFIEKNCQKLNQKSQ